MARPKQKSGRKAPKFVMLRHDLLDHPDYINLSLKAKALLVDILRQYNGTNNGDFCSTLSVMKKRGWNSNDTIQTSIKELINANLLLLTVNLHSILTHHLHRKLTRLSQPEYGLTFSRLASISFRGLFESIAVIAGFNDVTVMG